MPPFTVRGRISQPLHDATNRLRFKLLDFNESTKAAGNERGEAAIVIRATTNVASSVAVACSSVGMN